MRFCLSAAAALLFLTYPAVILFSLARNIDQPPSRLDTAAINATTRPAKRQADVQPARGTYGELRNTTLRGSR